MVCSSSRETLCSENQWENVETQFYDQLSLPRGRRIFYFKKRYIYTCFTTFGMQWGGIKMWPLGVVETTLFKRYEFNQMR